jgi:Type II secretion system (T2SS), protein E, N-terminal domain
MGKLGQLLVARGWITVQQLTRALQSQNSVGGRLGTCLIEMDVLGEDLLARSLSEQQGVPAAGIEELRGIPDEVLHLIPEKLARRCRAVPFRVAGGRLDVAMQDPRNLVGQDEIAFACGRRVKVHVLHELRIYEALQRYYREECPSRYSLLLDRLNRARYLWGERVGAGAATGEARGDRTEVLRALPAGDLLGAPPRMAPPPLPEPALPPLPRRRSLFRSRTAANPSEPPAAGADGGGEILPPLEELDLRARPQRQRGAPTPPPAPVVTAAAPQPAAAAAPQVKPAAPAAASAPASAPDAAAAGPADAGAAATEAAAAVGDRGAGSAPGDAAKAGAVPAAPTATTPPLDGDDTAAELPGQPAPPASAQPPGVTAAPADPQQPSAAVPGQALRPAAAVRPLEVVRAAGIPDEALPPLPAAAARAARRAADLETTVVMGPRATGAHATVLPAAPDTAAGPRRTTTGTAHVVQKIVLSAEERSSLGLDDAPADAGNAGDPAPAPAPPRPAPADLAQVEAEFAATTDLEEVGHIVLSYLAQSFRRVALFQVTRTQVTGWMAAGEGIDQEAFARYRVGLDEPSVFLNLQQGSGMHLGPLPAMQAHRKLALCWGGGLPRDCVVLPVRLRDRLVTVIYADGGNRGFAGIDLEDMQRLRATTATAFERCIIHKKHGYPQS